MSWHKPEWCIECCDTHSQARRLAILERLGNTTPAQVYEALGDQATHIWPLPRSLGRDLAANRAKHGWENHMPARWTGEEISLIKKLILLGKTQAQIGFQLGRTGRAVNHFIAKHKKAFTHESGETRRDRKAHPWRRRCEDGMGVRQHRS